MGEALAAGLRRRDGAFSLGVVDPVPARVDTARTVYGAEDFTGRLEEFFSFARIIILAVRPQEADSLFQEISPYAKNKRFISIVAGKTLPHIRLYLHSPYLARLMPNLAAIHGRASVGLSFLEGARDQEGEDFHRDTQEIAAALGEVVELPEGLLPVMTGLSGSGIAFAFAFVHALALGGVKCGLSYDQAREVALTVLEGAAAVLREGGENPVALIAKVASPAGTTIAGLQELEDVAFTSGVMAAVEAASLRARELEIS